MVRVVTVTFSFPSLLKLPCHSHTTPTRHPPHPCSLTPPFSLLRPPPLIAPIQHPLDSHLVLVPLPFYSLISSTSNTPEHCIPLIYGSSLDLPQISPSSHGHPSLGLPLVSLPLSHLYLCTLASLSPCISLSCFYL